MRQPRASVGAVSDTTGEGGAGEGVTKGSTMAGDAVSVAIG
ncbi:MAG TPA: hypothetical protein VHG29_09980 [Novosphingobium sp.]|nr:hypothetical protein [Novosphingobium sp.]